MFLFNTATYALDSTSATASSPVKTPFVPAKILGINRNATHEGQPLGHAGDDQRPALLALLLHRAMKETDLENDPGLQPDARARTPPGL